MPIDRTDRQFDPRQRIVGAIILVSLAVIFVPMVLDERPPLGPAIARLNEIPAPMPKVTVPVASPAAPPAPATHKVVHAPDGIPAAKPPARPEKGVHRVSAERAPTAVTIKAAEAADKGWFVQVGTFSNADNARQLADKLKQSGFSPRTDNVQLAQGRAVRVRVGPFPGGDDAKTALARIEETVGIKGVLLAYQ